jgi:hypothetical protein
MNNLVIKEKNKLKIIIFSFASVFFLSQTANAEFKVENVGTLSFTAGVQSAYISKGVDANSDRPAYNAAIDFVAPTSVVDLLCRLF